MSDQFALLAAIRDHPEEHTPRLAYADWLDEQGGEENNARSELIRTQCELVNVGTGYRLSGSGECQRRLEAREKQLIKKYRDRWLAGFPIPKKRDTVGFSLGFLHRLELDAQRCLPPPRPPWEREPMVTLSLSGTVRAQR